MAGCQVGPPETELWSGGREGKRMKLGGRQAMDPGDGGGGRGQKSRGVSFPFEKDDGGRCAENRPWEHSERG